MFLTQTSHYALRAMTGLVISKDSRPVNSKELSVYADVPSHYLSKIMRKMVEAGYVASQKGHGGGFIMKTAPADLRVIDVLTAAGFDMEDQPCVFGYDECSNDDPCPLHPVWKRLKDCFEDWACNTTFEDVRNDNEMIDRAEFMKKGGR